MDNLGIRTTDVGRVDNINTSIANADKADDPDIGIADANEDKRADNLDTNIVDGDQNGGVDNVGINTANLDVAENLGTNIQTDR